MKITPDRLARGAFIYIRQSTVDQLANNHESRLRQYGLADRARALGWTDVTVIDDDLHRKMPRITNPRRDKPIMILRTGDVVAARPLDFYQAVGRRLAYQGDQP